MQRDTAVPCTCSKSCRATCSDGHVQVFMSVHMHKPCWRWSGVRRAGGLSLPPPACDNPKGCGACWWMCVHLFPFVLFITFNPLGRISELKNFRADIAF